MLLQDISRPTVSSPVRRRWTKFLLLPSLLFAPLALADTFCVHNNAELNYALQDVSTNGPMNDRANTIRLAGATYQTFGTSFYFETHSGFALTLDGGYDATCTTRDAAQTASVLDGRGLDTPLAMNSNGSITVSHITVQNGFIAGSNGGGINISLTSPSAEVVLEGNVIRDNVSTFGAAGVLIGGSGIEARVSNNLFINNSAPFASALYLVIVNGATAYFTNNTIVHNSCSRAYCEMVSIGGEAGGASAYVSNSIAYGNTGPDFTAFVGCHVVFQNNDYVRVNGTQANGSGGNVVNVNPMFVGTDDFHLAPNSPLLDIGLTSPPGGLPSTDIEGRPRMFVGKVDLGAYQHGDIIFANAFEG
jgi:hypothetical protein